jgi:hypothetical protein
MPHTLELPRAGRAVVPLVGAGHAVTPSYTNLLPTGAQVLPPSLERWIICPNQPDDWDAKSRFGSAGDPLR